MRKHKREMSAEWALEMFDHAPYVTVSMADQGGNPYAVPLNLARTDEKTFWFHCAMEGRKLDILKTNPKVFLSAVSRCMPAVGPKDGSFTLEYKSATAVGTAELVEDPAEKQFALRAICERFLPAHMDAFDAAIARSLARTMIVKITLAEPPVGKRKEYDANGDEIPGNAAN